ncbi:MAG: hypothetical protein GF334_01140 [Candidatus Altiarchaeales archaeon]|nr:hypothetical protein [Candidatus Altiarchaeales archaeon]
MSRCTRRRRGQASIELIASLGFVLLIFAVAGVGVLHRSRTASDLKTYLDVEVVGRTLTDNIETINQQGQGYWKLFSIPNYLRGGYDYNVSVKRGVLEIRWGGEGVWTHRLSSVNVTIINMDKGLDKQNKVKYTENGIQITGHRPNLRPLPGSFIVKDNETHAWVNCTVENDAHVDMESTDTLDIVVAMEYDDGTGNKAYNIQTVDGFRSYERRLIVFPETHLMQSWDPEEDYRFTVYVDNDTEINESIEFDNIAEDVKSK